MSQAPGQGNISAAEKAEDKRAHKEREQKTEREHPALHGEAHSGHVELF